jgi:hypothetical protein
VPFYSKCWDNTFCSSRTLFFLEVGRIENVVLNRSHPSWGNLIFAALFVSSPHSLSPKHREVETFACWPTETNAYRAEVSAFFPITRQMTLWSRRKKINLRPCEISNTQEQAEPKFLGYDCIQILILVSAWAIVFKRSTFLRKRGIFSCITALPRRCLLRWGMIAGGGWSTVSYAQRLTVGQCSESYVLWPVSE